MPQKEKIMGFKVAIVGATGNVGREMLNILAEREFPADEVVALASRRSQGVDMLGYVVWSSLFAVPPLLALSLLTDRKSVV